MSNLARQLIAENKRTRAKFLDLGNCGLTEVPAAVAALVWLESIAFSDEWWEFDGTNWGRKQTGNKGRKNDRLTDIRPLAHLTALQKLILKGTQVSELGALSGLTALQTLDLASTPVGDPAALSGLTALQTLDLSNTPVSDLGALSGLTALQTLDLSSTNVSDLGALSGLTALQTLDLTSTQVTDLGALSKLTALQSLDLTNIQVGDLGALAGLTALQSLQLANTHVSDLGALSGLTALQTLQLQAMPASDLGALSGLTALQTLQLQAMPVSDLSALSRLTALQTLHLSFSPVRDLEALSGLTALQALDLWNTPVSDLRPLSGLAALRTLHLGETQVSDLGALSGLAALRTLNVADSKVADLAPLLPLIRRGVPVQWSNESWRGAGIYVEGCPLTSPPPEIVQQGNAAILSYFEERAQGEVDHLYEAKLLILGEGGAGKTSLLRRLYQPDQPLPTEQETTRGIAIHCHEFDLPNGRRFRLNVWDFGGQEIYHATHQFFLTHRSLYLLVDDTRKDHKSVSDSGFKDWLELIDTFSGHSPVLLFQNEKGGRSKAIDFAGIVGRYDNVKERYAANLEHSDSASQLREAIVYFASHLDHIGEELPARWIQVRADIEARAAEVPHIPQREFFEIYDRHLPHDRTKTLHLSRYLHDLGVFLHFQDDPLLARTVILQNQWATKAVFCILDDEIVKRKYGRFDASDCERFWADSVYADMHPELLALMQRFELCYELRDSRPPTWLAPQLLPPSRPPELAESGQPGDLVLRYCYTFLPKGIISRLTVRMHRFVRTPDLAWATGALFERDHTTVLVELLPNGGEIELRARGPERKGLLSVIAADLDAINASFQGLRDKVEKLIPCNCPVCQAETVPAFFKERDLVRRKEHGRRTVECPVSYQEVEVLSLLDGLGADELPRWAKPAPTAARTRTLRIFLASSNELEDDRDEFELYFRRQNDEAHITGRYLEIIRWENFLDAMSETRLQDEYNKKVRAADVVVCLFFTKVGKYTEEEFDVADQQFRKSGRPRIFTYFKNADIKTGSAREEDLQSLWAFKKKLKSMGHFPTPYDNAEHLKRHFRDQLDKLREMPD